MDLIFTPQRRDATLALVRHGDRLSLNGAEIDFSDLAEGAVLSEAETGSPWIKSVARSADGRLEVTLILPHGPDAPEARCDPGRMRLTGDGPVPFPGDVVETVSDPGHPAP